jgi:hypothetical protein
VGASLIPDNADARGRAGGARVGAGGARVGAYRGAHVSRPIARPGVGYGRYAGYGRYGYRRGVGWGVGAAAVGAAAVGAGYYSNSNNGCYYDSYGQLLCPNQYQY